jgi:hypothetical protein
VSINGEAATDARTVAFPDASGTVALFDGSGNLTVSGILYANHIHGNLAGSVYAHIRAGEELAKGDPVYISGSHGTAPNLIPIVSKADASNPAKMPAIGIMDAALANNANGHMVITGTIADLNTAAYAVNDTLYVATGGGLTATPPAANSQPVARVERSNSNNGAVIVKVNGLASNGGNGVSDANKLVRFSSTGGVNFNAGAGTSLVITGNLTVDTNTFFVDSTNNRVGIGTTSPTAGYSLDVTGAIRSTGNLLLQGNIVYLNSQRALTQGVGSLTLGEATYFTSLAYGNASTTQHTFNGSGITAATASFTSTTRPTSAGTGTPAATSLMTRDDVALESFYTLGSVFRVLATPSFGNSGTGSGASQAAGDRWAAIGSGTSNSGWGRVTIGRGITTLPAASGAGINFAQKLGVSIVCWINRAATTDDGNIFRLRFGSDNTPVADGVDAVSYRGFGVEIKSRGSSHDWRVYGHNGTAITYSAWTNASLINDLLYARLCLSVMSDGAGNITARLGQNGSRTLSTITTTGGPTSAGASTQAFIEAHVANSTTGTTNLAAALYDALFYAQS